MRALSNIGAGLVLLATLISGCYAHTPPGPTCAQDPNQQGCFPPIHDQKKPK